MRKNNIFVLALFLSQAGAQILGSQALSKEYTIVTKNVNTKTESVKYQANTNFEVCNCDMIKGACDSLCCCDSECSENVRNQWKEAELCTDVEYFKDKTLI